MRVIYYQSPNGNFGDDLNAVLWRELLAPACFDVDDAVLLGIGSILRDDFSPKRPPRVSAFSFWARRRHRPAAGTVAECRLVDPRRARPLDGTRDGFTACRHHR